MVSSTTPIPATLRRSRWFSGARRFFLLPKAERRTWRRAWWRLLRADLALRLRPARTLERALAAEGSGRDEGAEPLAADRLAELVGSAAAHHLWSMGCLPRSIALRRLLADRGVAARLRVGVRKEGAELLAHAWVESAGRVVGEAEPVEARFLPLVDASGRAQ